MFQVWEFFSKWDVNVGQTVLHHGEKIYFLFWHRVCPMGDGMVGIIMG